VMYCRWWVVMWTGERWLVHCAVVYVVGCIVDWRTVASPLCCSVGGGL